MKKAAYSLSIIFLFLVVISGFKTKSNNMLKTSLQITVIDGMGSYVEGAEVTIYSNEEDFRNSESPIQDTQLTDEKGRVLFKDLKPQAYFVDAVKGDMSNYGAAQLTPELMEGRRNKVNIVIE